MGLIQEQIKQKFSEFIGQFNSNTIFAAIVTAINNNNTVAVQFSNGSTVDDVRLKSAVKDGNNVIVTPSVDSPVLVGRIEESEEYVIIAVSDIDSWSFKIGNVSYTATSNGHVITNGTDNMWDAMNLLFESLEQILVLEGNNPDFAKMAQAKLKFKNILNGT